MKKEDIDKIERVQRSFTARIKGLEDMDYHERLKTLNTYSLERRRERFLEGDETKKRPPCFEFRDKGTCSRGENCKFSHE